MTGGFFSRPIRSALGCSFLLEALVHSTCRRGVLRLQSRRSFRRSSTSGRLRLRGRQRRNLPEARCPVDWTHLKAAIHSPRVIGAGRRRRRTHLPIFTNLVQAGWVSVDAKHRCVLVSVRLTYSCSLVLSAAEHIKAYCRHVPTKVMSSSHKTKVSHHPCNHHRHISC